MARKKNSNITPTTITPEICVFYLADGVVIIAYFFGLVDRDKLILSQPRVFTLPSIPDDPDQELDLNHIENDLKLIKWIPHVKDDIVHIRESFVVSVLEPTKELISMYIESTSEKYTQNNSIENNSNSNSNNKSLSKSFVSLVVNNTHTNSSNNSPN